MLCQLLSGTPQNIAFDDLMGFYTKMQRSIEGKRCRFQYGVRVTAVERDSREIAAGARPLSVRVGHVEEAELEWRDDAAAHGLAVAEPVGGEAKQAHVVHRARRHERAVGVAPRAQQARRRREEEAALRAQERVGERLRVALAQLAGAAVRLVAHEQRHRRS